MMIEASTTQKKTKYNIKEILWFRFGNKGCKERQAGSCAWNRKRRRRKMSKKKEAKAYITLN